MADITLIKWNSTKKRPEMVDVLTDTPVVLSLKVGTTGSYTEITKALIDGKLDKSGGTMSGAIAMGSNKITGLAQGTDSNDAVTKAQLDAAVAGLDFQADVLNIQTDDTLDPGATPTEGDRYIITNASNLNTNFGTITGLANNDIVEYQTSAFVVVYDVSVQGEGALVWDRNSNTFQKYDGTSWSEFGGLAGVTAGDGLTKSGNTLNVGAGDGISVAADSVTVNLDGSTLSKSASGVKVADAGITATQIAAAALGNGLTGGAGTALAVEADSTGGSNLATVINVSANGVAVKIDDSSIGENGSNQLEVKADGINDTHIDFGTGANQVADDNLPSVFTPSNYSPSQVASEGNDKVSAHLKGIDTALGSIGADVDTFTAGEDIAIRDLCFIKSDGKMYKAQGDADANFGRTFVAKAAVLTDASGEFYAVGSKVSGFSGLTPGTDYYLSQSSAGGYSTKASLGNASGSSQIRAFTALSATEIRIDYEVEMSF